MTNEGNFEAIFELLEPRLRMKALTPKIEGKAKKKASKENSGKVFFGEGPSWSEIELELAHHLSSPQLNELKESKKPINFFSTSAGTIYVVGTPKASMPKATVHSGRLDSSPYSRARDLMGPLLNLVKAQSVTSLYFCKLGSTEPSWSGISAGLEVASYRFLDLQKRKSTFLSEIVFEKTAKPSGLEEQIIAGQKLGMSVNLTRHLVNLPPNLLNPGSFSQILKRLAHKSKNLECEVWGPERLKKEKMGLILGVGQGATSGPFLVQLRYRKGKGSKIKKIFVGKGITFDSGGLDIKPSSGMRLMKKDMGGAGALAGLAWWLDSSGLQENIDFYFPLAENSVSSRSFRPSDVLISRKGYSVEIHNTDAEGRLVLADALTLACEKKPEILINVATLTGAIKAGLGSELPGLFSNNDDLAHDLETAAQASGEWIWRMPLYAKYRDALNSNFADLVNANDGFGGAINGALFLEAFVGETPWAHFDIYAWKDKSEGAILEAGASGQAVQLLAQYLKTVS